MSGLCLQDLRIEGAEWHLLSYVTCSLNILLSVAHEEVWAAVCSADVDTRISAPLLLSLDFIWVISMLKKDMIS